MGEIADDLHDRMMDDDYYDSPFSGYERKGRYRTPPDSYYKKAKVKEYPAKTFDMGFFPTSIPKPRIIGEAPPVEPDPWATDGESPF